MSIEKYFADETPIPWAVEQLIGLGHNAMIYGRKGSGKSMLAWFMASSIARGEKLLERFDCKTGRCLIIDEETPHTDLRDRIQKTFDPVLDAGISDIWEISGFKFSDPHRKAELKKYIQENNITVIVFDNLNAMQGDWDLERSNTDVGNLRRYFNDLRSVNPELTIILIHHEGLTSNRPRGASALEDMSDTVIRLARLSDNPFQFIVQPIARKRPAYKTFIVKLNTANGKFHPDFVREVEGELVIPSDEAIELADYFLLNREAERTVDEICDFFSGKLSKSTIRIELKTLYKNGFLEVGRGAHNLQRFWLSKSGRGDDNMYSNMLIAGLIEKWKRLGIYEAMCKAVKLDKLEDSPA